jgi:hypothetical protein
MMVHREKFVNASAFLKSARDMGIGVEEGVYEIIDNSFDADAENIWIEIDKKEDGNFQFIFTDDGAGIPKEHTDEDGVKHQGIPYVLTYGGRIPNPYKPEPIGKFGFGLSQTASCLSSRTEVYTKTADDEQWRYSYYDFDELLDADELLLPEETIRQPPWIELPETGTIVVMKNVDQSDYVQANAIMSMLLKNLGRVYRIFLANGCSIRISQGKKEKEVMISDPLVELEDSLEYQNLGGESLDYGEIVIKFDSENPLGEIIDPVTEKPAECAIRFRRLGIETVRNALGLPLVGAGENVSKALNKWKINPQGQGFSILRNGREIRNSETLRLFTKGSHYNYFRAHVAFSSVLDDLFHVKTNKSQFHIDPELRELLKQHTSEIIEQVNTDSRYERNMLNKRRSQHVIPVAEVVAADIGHMLVKPRLTDEERKKGDNEIKQKITQLINHTKQTNAAMVKDAQIKLQKAKQSNNKSEMAVAETNLKVVEERATKTIATIEKRFAFESNCRKFTDVIGSGGLFEISSHADHAWITINTATEFYSRVYSLAEKDIELEGLLDLMIFSIAWSEHVDTHDNKVNWEHIRREISAQAEIFVSSMKPLIEGGEA